jgi:hypothetical protein
MIRLRSLRVPSCFAVASLLALTGCPGGFGQGDGGIERCEMDRHECVESEITPDASCMLDGDLTVELGQGVEAFESLADGEDITEYSAGGGFQSAGTSHISVAVRVSGVALDRYDELGVYVDIFDAVDCPDATRECSGNTYGHRQVALGQLAPLVEVEPGMIEAAGITLVSDAGSSSGAGLVVKATVVDPCGQSGFAQHAY